MNFFEIWIVGALIIAATGALVGGLAHDSELTCAVISLALIWPIAAGIALLVGPFVGLFYLGQYLSTLKIGSKQS